MSNDSSHVDITMETGLGWGNSQMFTYPVVRMECTECGTVEKVAALQYPTSTVHHFVTVHTSCK